MSKHLRVIEHGFFQNVFTEMERLGIDWQHAEHLLIGEQWWFFNCENVPEKLPHYIEELHGSIESYLKGEDLKKVLQYRKSDVFREMETLAKNGIESELKYLNIRGKYYYFLKCKRGKMDVLQVLHCDRRVILEALKKFNDQ